MASGQREPAASAGPIAAQPDRSLTGEEPGEGRYLESARLGLGRALALSSSGLVAITAGSRIAFDAEGRWHRAWLDELSYERGLSGRVRRVDPRRSHGRQRPVVTLLDDDRARSISERVVRMLRELDVPRELPTMLGEPLKRALGWTPARYAAERARFEALYAPVSVLPPDQNRALVVQATLGCSWGRCTFCRLYETQEYSVRDPEQFRAHVRGVVDFVGGAIAGRRGVFLGQGGALNLPYSALARLLDVLREELVTPRPVAAFADYFSELPSLHELRELRSMGLESVTFGLESGSERILARLRKPVQLPRAVELTQRARAAGLQCGITVLVGAGGPERTEEHATETARVLGAMQLGPADRVYLSPLRSRSGAGASDEAVEELRSVIRGAGIRARVALYDVRRFVY